MSTTLNILQRFSNCLDFIKIQNFDKLAENERNHFSKYEIQKKWDLIVEHASSLRINQDKISGNIKEHNKLTSEILLNYDKLISKLENYESISPEINSFEQSLAKLILILPPTEGKKRLYYKR